MIKSTKTSLCVFCGSGTGNKPIYVNAAKDLGKAISNEGLTLIYGGGSLGIMGALASSVLENGCSDLSIIGIMPTPLKGDLIGTTLFTKDMHERKAMMNEKNCNVCNKADCFIALPGGCGTLEELLEIITWYQLGIHDKPIGILNINGYFDNLIAMLKTAVAEGFTKESKLENIIIDNDAISLLQKVRNYNKIRADELSWKPLVEG